MTTPRTVTAAQLEAAAVNAIEAIEHAQTVQDAATLLRKVRAYQSAVERAKLSAGELRRWGGVRLQAERKLGELLGPPEPGRPKGNVSGGYAERARKVAAVPEQTFMAYIAAAEQPTRAGLLRVARTVAPAPVSAIRRIVGRPSNASDSPRR